MLKRRWKDCKRQRRWIRPRKHILPDTIRNYGDSDSMNMTCSEQNRKNASLEKRKWTQSSTYYQLWKAISVFFDGLLLGLPSYFKEGFTSSGELDSMLLGIFLFAFAFSYYCFCFLVYFYCLFWISFLFLLLFFFMTERRERLWN